MGWHLLFDMKIQDILSFKAETYSFGEHHYTEHTLRTQCDPLSLLQLLAFNGRMRAGDGNVVQLHDWEKLPPEVEPNLPGMRARQVWRDGGGVKEAKAEN